MEFGPQTSTSTEFWLLVGSCVGWVSCVGLGVFVLVSRFEDVMVNNGLLLESYRENNQM